MEMKVIKDKDGEVYIEVFMPTTEYRVFMLLHSVMEIRRMQSEDIFR